MQTRVVLNDFFSIPTVWFKLVFLDYRTGIPWFAIKLKITWQMGESARTPELVGMNLTGTTQLPSYVPPQTESVVQPHPKLSNLSVETSYHDHKVPGTLLE